MDQPVTAEASDQLTPVPAGSGSLIATVVAGPAPVLLSETVKPICVPALTEAASAVFVSVRAGGRTTVMGTSNPSQLHFDLFAKRVPKRKPSGLAVAQLGALTGSASGKGQDLSAPGSFQPRQEPMWSRLFVLPTAVSQTAMKVPSGRSFTTAPVFRSPHESPSGLVTPAPSGFVGRL